MDEALYTSLLEALAVVNSGGGGNAAEFQAAQQFCVEFWSRSDAADYARYILSTPAEGAVPVPVLEW